MSTPLSQPDDAQVIAATERWVERAVIGLNLCPFAKAVQTKRQVRYVVSAATTAEALLEQLMDELQLLSDTDPEEVDTTLLIHPFVLQDFLDYNEFLDIADAAVEDMQLEGELQIASFHPDYQFADTDVNDIDNFTNRSPYPTLQLLREDSIDRAVAAFPEAEAIFEKNIETMQALGHDGWDQLDVGPARGSAIFLFSRTRPARCLCGRTRPAWRCVPPPSMTSAAGAGVRWPRWRTGCR